MIKKSIYPLIFAVILTLFGGSVVGWAQDNDVPKVLPAAQDGKIRFTAFDKTEWRPIIEWFADQTGLSLEFIDPPPEGTFTYQDDTEYSIQDAMDLLNDRLMMRGRALVRSHNSLILLDITKGIPSELIESVRPEDLDSRGKYEILRCVFDISGLDASQIQRDVQQLVASHHQRSMVTLAAAQQMIVQEAGGKLRVIRDIIENAKKNSGLENWNLVSIELKHISPEELLVHVDVLGIDRTTLRAPDGSINLSFDALGTRVLASGLPDKLSQFRRLVETVDVPSAGEGMENLEAPYFRTYAVRTDAELLYNVAGTLLAGRPEVRLDFDEKSGQLFLYGRTADHELLLEAINDSRGTSDDFAVITMKEMDADDMVDILQTMFRQDPLSDEAGATGPVFESLIDGRLVVRGTPQEVSQVQAIIQALDVPNVIPPSERTQIRHLPLTRSESEQALDIFEQLVPTLGLQNDIRVEMPDERSFRFNTKRRAFELEGLDNDQEDTNDRGGASDAGVEGKQGSLLPGGRNVIAPSSRMLMSWIAVGPSNMLTYFPQDEEKQDNGSGETSSDDTDETDQVEEPKSVPGAPITIRITDYGIILISEDLVALDAIEQMIYQQLDEVSVDAPPTFFFLKYRGAEEAKQILETYLGVSSGGGGGGGSPLTSMLGGALQNTVGGAAGDMLGGLFGGGGSSAAGDGVFEPEGPIVIEADNKLQSLFVRATVRDMDIIRELIEMIDRPEAPQGPNALGRTYLIPILYRDPVEVEEHVRQHFSTVLRSEEQAGGNGGNPQAQIERQIMQQLLGRGGRGGGGSAAQEIEPPKASLSVDNKNMALVVTGPEFLYQQIFDLVRQIDKPNITPDPAVDLIETGGKMSAATLARMLKAALGDKVEIIDNSGLGNSGGSSTTPRTGGSGTSGGSTSAVMGFNPDQLNRIRQIQDQMRRANQGGNTRGGGTNRGGGTGGNRGGGDTGGGNRGGRGG